MADVKKAVAKKEGKKKESSREVGKTTGEGVVRSWVIALEKGAKAKQNDEQILDFMKKEFPGKTNLCSVGTARGHYNRGGYNKGVKPKTQLAKFGEAKKEEKKATASAPAKKTVIVVKKKAVAVYRDADKR